MGASPAEQATQTSPDGVASVDLVDDLATLTVKLDGHLVNEPLADLTLHLG